LIVLLLCVLVTGFFAFQATRVQLNADFNDTIPTHQPYIVNYMKHYADLRSQGNAIRVVVQADHGTIIDAHYLKVLEQISNQIYLLPNVDRAFMTSLWTSSTRWTAVTSNGIANGPVIGQNYDGTAAQLLQVKKNIELAGLVGSMVSDDSTSSMIYIPLLEYDNLTHKPVNYGQLARTLNAMRRQYASQGVTLHIIGFGMVVGDMINDIGHILLFFGISAVIAGTVLFCYTRCIRSTLLVLAASLTAVIWQMGTLPLLGFDLTPYSVLVPFLIFAIGMSHGAQKMNGVMQDIGRGSHPLVAARYTFRRLFLAGFSALACDAASFAALMVIQVEAIRQLAMLASIGVAFLILTNLILLPIILSYTGVSKKAALRSLQAQAGTRTRHPVLGFLDLFTTRRYASLTLLAAVGLGALGLYVGSYVQVGDLNQGAPELRQSSQYNRDNAYIIQHFSEGSDTMVVLVDTLPNACTTYRVLSTMDNLQWQLDQMPEVKSTSSLGSFESYLIMLLNENTPKWHQLVQNQALLDDTWSYVPRSLANFDCTFLPLSISLVDHKAATLSAVLGKLNQFIAQPTNQSSQFKISLVGGDAGIAAATNLVIAQANHLMLLLVYATVVFFCIVVFRSWRAVVCAVLPLMLTSILAQALMVWLGIGITVANLPVTALGVGIGVDYALYTLGIVMKQLRAGASLSDAYHQALLFTGKVVLLTGLTLAAGVATWAFAPIKFQASMGLLLSFMFLWNMVGALVLVPSLAYFLLPPRIFADHQKPQFKI
jgi:predicted RND superfamily exporter protein